MRNLVIKVKLSKKLEGKMSENEKDDDIFSEKEKQAEIDPNPLAATLDELNDLLEKERQKSLRLLADYQNLEKQTIDRINTRGDKIILDFLTVYEDFISAKDAYEKEGGNVDSLNGIIKNMETILDHYEVKPIEAGGKKLDPKLHEVVQDIEDNDHEEGTMSENEKDDDIFSEKEKQVEIDPNPLVATLDELNDLL